jgi:hypothetical protein
MLRRNVRALAFMVVLHLRPFAALRGKHGIRRGALIAVVAIVRLAVASVQLLTRMTMPLLHREDLLALLLSQLADRGFRRMLCRPPLAGADMRV